MTLPPRTRQAEKSFVEKLHSKPAVEIEQAISFAIKERRPNLAGQLFLLLDKERPLNDSLKRAQQALQFSITSPQQWQDLEEAWDDFTTSKRIQRMKSRHRSKDDLRNRPWKRR
jgi:hypothetical protein